MRKKRCVLAFVMVLALTGCGPDVPDLSKLDNDMTGQYMADALLAHDKNYNDSLEYDHSVLEPTPEPTKKPAAKKPETSESPGTSENHQKAAGRLLLDRAAKRRSRCLCPISLAFPTSM